MKILLLNTTDTKGGAARAAYRLHQGLGDLGISSQMLVQEKFSSDTMVHAPGNRVEQGIARGRISFDALPLKCYSQTRKANFSLQWLPERIASQVATLTPDIINIHWTGSAFLRWETLARFKQPVVWTLHDMGAFTGGCFYAHDCQGYTASCGKCPQLGSHREKDLSRWMWRRKAKAWRNLDLTVVTPSHWLAKCAMESSLFRDIPIKVIPNGVDISKYRPIPQSTARELLRLSQNKHIIMFGSLNATSDRRKGFHLLQPALQKLSQAGWGEKAQVVVFGASQGSNSPELGFKTDYLGTLKDDLSLALAYSAADVFVLPSLQENLANTVMEALACGTPCVAFDIGGMPDMIENESNGYLAKPYQVEDLAAGIAWVLDNSQRLQKLSNRAREKVAQKFTQEIQAHRYRQLFEAIKNQGKGDEQ